MATLEEVRLQVATLSPSELQELVSVLPPPTGAQLGRLWYLLISVLSVGAVLAGVAAYNIYNGPTPMNGAVFLAITTTIVGGLIGLLAPSPVTQR
jgi:hypothetical protein